MSLSFYIKKIQDTPLLYQVFFKEKNDFDEDKKIHIGYKTLKYYHLHKRDAGFDLQILIEQEYVNLQNDLLQYCSQREVSEKQVELWLNKRKASAIWKQRLKDFLKENNFIDSKRFVEVFVNKRKVQGNKPWFFVKQELLNQGIDEEIINEYKYDDFEILLNSKNNQKKIQFLSSQNDSEMLKKEMEKIKKRMTYQGFSYQTIQDFVKYIKEK